MLKINLLLICMLCVSALAWSAPKQYIDTLQHQNSNKVANAHVGTSVFNLSPFGFQVQVGTQGVGIDFRKGVLNKLSVRLGVSAIPVNTNYNFTVTQYHIATAIQVKFYNVHLLADYAPFAQARGIRLVGGLGCFNQAYGEGLATPTNSTTIGDIVLTPEQLGNLKVNISWKGVAPYLGIGLLRSFPQRLFNVNLDLGAYYLNQPKATIIGTKLLSGNDAQEGLVNQNLSDYRFLPVIQLNFNFKIR